MPINILMPALSPTMEEGTLAKWLIKEGDTVSSGDVMAEIETDKATMEFEAVDEGVLGKILVADGTEGVKVNEPIAVLLEEGESASDIKADEPSGDGQGKSATRIGQSDQDEPADSKPPEPVSAGANGGTQVRAPAAPKSSGERIFSSPLARRIAAERGVDLTRIRGSGPHGRVIKADVESAESAPTEKAAAPSAGSVPGPVEADTIKKLYGDREFEELKLDGMRKTIAARLTEAKQTVPHFYLRREIRLDALLKFRTQLNKELEQRGVKLSVNDFVIKASAIALQQVPDCNAVWANDRILRFNASDVAVAVAIEGGLFTPVLRDADTKSLSALSAEMKDLATRARERKLAPHEYQGGSFAVSNLGMMGVENFDAVINPPHGSILAVGAGIRKPVVTDNDEIGAATLMSVTLSVDHRVIDGALGAQFLEALRQNIEHPIAMLA